MKKTIDTLGKPLIIAIEGVNGSGKSTLARKLHGWLLENVTNPVIKSRQVGGTALGEKLRDCMHLPGNDPLAKVLMAAASMRQQVSELPNDAILLTDRWKPSTFAYQGKGDGMSFFQIANAFEAANVPHSDLDIVLILSLDNCINRARYILNPDYLTRVINFFDTATKSEEGVLPVDANTLSADDVFNQSVAFLSEKLGIYPVVTEPLKIGDRVVVTECRGFKITRVGCEGVLKKSDVDDMAFLVDFDNDCSCHIDVNGGFGEYNSDNYYLKVTKITPTDTAVIEQAFKVGDGVFVSQSNSNYIEQGAFGVIDNCDEDEKETLPIHVAFQNGKTYFFDKNGEYWLCGNLIAKIEKQ